MCPKMRGMSSGSAPWAAGSGWCHSRSSSRIAEPQTRHSLQSWTTSTMVRTESSSSSCHKDELLHYWCSFRTRGARSACRVCSGSWGLPPPHVHRGLRKEQAPHPGCTCAGGPAPAWSAHPFVGQPAPCHGEREHRHHQGGEDDEYGHLGFLPAQITRARRGQGYPVRWGVDQPAGPHEPPASRVRDAPTDRL